MRMDKRILWTAIVIGVLAGVGSYWYLKTSGVKADDNDMTVRKLKDSCTLEKDGTYKKCKVVVSGATAGSYIVKDMPELVNGSSSSKVATNESEILKQKLKDAKTCLNSMSDASAAGYSFHNATYNGVAGSLLLGSWKINGYTLTQFRARKALPSYCVYNDFYVAVGSKFFEEPSTAVAPVIAPVTTTPTTTSTSATTTTPNTTGSSTATPVQ